MKLKKWFFTIFFLLFLINASSTYASNVDEFCFDLLKIKVFALGYDFPIDFSTFENISTTLHAKEEYGEYTMRLYEYGKQTSFKFDNKAWIEERSDSKENIIIFRYHGNSLLECEFSKLTSIGNYSLMDINSSEVSNFKDPEYLVLDIYDQSITGTKFLSFNHEFKFNDLSGNPFFKVTKINLVPAENQEAYKDALYSKKLLEEGRIQEFFGEIPESRTRVGIIMGIGFSFVVLCIYFLRKYLKKHDRMH